MANIENSTALVPSPSTPAGQGLTFTIQEFDAAGNKQTMTIPMPNSVQFAKWTIEQQVGMLKRGPWSKITIGDIFFGLAYANKIGADVFLGELFPTGEGRFGTSNKFKIKQGFKTGRIESFEVDIRDTKEPIDLVGCIQKTDLECTVTLEVKGLKKPIIRRARLSRWFNVKNPNWLGKPEHMLELNTFAHACEYIPGDNGLLPSIATEEDEAPPMIEMPERPEPVMVTRQIERESERPREVVYNPPSIPPTPQDLNYTSPPPEPEPLTPFPSAPAPLIEAPFHIPQEDLGSTQMSVRDLVADLKKEVAQEKAKVIPIEENLEAKLKVSVEQVEREKAAPAPASVGAVAANPPPPPPPQPQPQSSVAIDIQEYIRQQEAEAAARKAGK